MEYCNVLLLLFMFLSYVKAFMSTMTACEPFTLVSYNVHGLPMIMTFDKTYKRMRQITEIIHKY